jgi:hypothetical protein
LKGTPVPYFSSAIIATAVVSYLSVPTFAGSSAVNIWQQALQRNRSISKTVAFNGPGPQSGSVSPVLSADKLFPRGIPGKGRPV